MPDPSKPFEPLRAALLAAGTLFLLAATVLAVKAIYFLDHAEVVTSDLHAVIAVAGPQALAAVADARGVLGQGREAVSEVHQAAAAFRKSAEADAKRISLLVAQSNDRMIQLKAILNNANTLVKDADAEMKRTSESVNGQKGLMRAVDGFLASTDRNVTGLVSALQVHTLPKLDAELDSAKKLTDNAAGAVADARPGIRAGSEILITADKASRPYREKKSAWSKIKFASEMILRWYTR